jgi:hypothetical protein
MLVYDPARVDDPAAWLAKHLPGAEVFEPKPVPRTLADLHDRLAGMSFGNFMAHDARTSSGREASRRRALVTRCGTMSDPMLTPAGLVPVAVAATPFDDLFVPEFRGNGRHIRPTSRVVALEIPLDDPEPAPRPLQAGPLRLVHSEDGSITDKSQLPHSYNTA